MVIDAGSITSVLPDQVLQGTIAGMPADFVAAATGLTAVLGLSLYTIWRNRVRATIPKATPSATSGFTRWLTPMGMQSISAAQAVAPRTPKASGSSRAIKVSTPVSKVSARALRSADATPLDIARKTGLSRDGVAMMLATSGRPAPKPAAVAKPVAVPAPTRTVATGRTPVMLAPGAYTAAPRTAPQAAARVLGTQFNARLG